VTFHDKYAYGTGRLRSDASAEPGAAIQEMRVAGFKLMDEGNFLRNPNDPRDKNTPDPPQPKDEFVLKFVKP
jgi:predicted methyltransferase